MSNIQWFLPTNTYNLSMMLSQGLITEPDGCSKYYEDVLINSPGYIPITNSADKNTIGKALKLATNESHLVPCIICINLNQITKGSFYCEDGKIINSADLVTLDAKVTTLYIPSPLPLQCISKVMFGSDDNKKKYENDVKTLYGNVSLSTLKLDASKSANKYITDILNKNIEPELIDQTTSSLSKEGGFSLPQRIKIVYSKVYAMGGVLGSLFYLTKNGKVSEDYFLEFPTQNFSEADVSEIQNIDNNFILIKNYFYTVSNPTSHSNTNSTVKMFFPILDILVEDKEVKNDIIKSLKENGLKEDKAIERSNEIAHFLLDYSRNKINKPASEIFEESRNKSKKSKIEMLLLMLFHRDNTEALFKYNLDIFEEIDYVLFAILMGIKDKYSGLPLFLKEYTNIQHYLSYMMAEYAHRLIGSDIIFKKTKPPLTLNNMLNPKKLGLILWLSEQLGLQSCFKSVMPNKIFTNSSGVSTYQGIVLPKFEKIEDEYFKLMSKKMVDDKLYNKILEKYKKTI